MSHSFLTLGDTGDELGYFRQLLDVAQQKSQGESYAERRASEMANGDMEDCSLEGKILAQLFYTLVYNNVTAK